MESSVEDKNLKMDSVENEESKDIMDSEANQQEN